MQEQVLFERFLKDIRIEPNLKQIQLFSQLFVRKHLKKDDYFIKDGKNNYDIAFLLEGIMRMYVVDEDGEETNLSFFTEDDYFSGGYAFGQKAVVNIQCLEDCTLLVAKGCDLIMITNRIHHVARSYNSMLDNIFKQSTLRLSNCIKYNGKERYELFLKNYPGLANRIPLFHIANYLGISSVQLSRIRAEYVK